MDRRIVAIVSPAPPIQNGIADYCVELATVMGRYFDMFWIISDDAPEPEGLPVDVAVIRAREIDRLSLLDEAVFVYHVGNNPDHGYMLDMMAKRPGLVVLHDFALNYLVESTAFPKDNRDVYIHWAQRAGGSMGGALARRLLRDGWKGPAFNHILPLNAPVLERAQAILVHSRYSQAKAAAVVPGKPVHYVAHHVAPEVQAYSGISRQAARAKLNLPSDVVLITALGFVSSTKLVGPVLRSLRRIAPQLPKFAFVLAGQRRPYEYDVDEDIAASGMADHVITTDFLNEEAFYLHLAAADIICNLRYPSGGESSGTLARALGMGRPCLVLGNGPIGELPDDVAYKIHLEDGDINGVGFERLLDAALLDLCVDPHLREAIGGRAGAYAESHLTIEGSAAVYREIIEGLSTKRAAQHGVVSGAFSLDSRWLARLDPEALGIACGSPERWWRVGGVPRAGTSSGRILLVSDDPVSLDALSSLYGWPVERILHSGLDDVDSLPREMVDFALIVAPWQRLLEDAALRLAIAERLPIGAGVCVEATGAPSLSVRWTPGDWLDWSGCGATVSLADAWAYSADRTGLDRPPEFREVWVGVRSSHVVVLHHRAAGDPMSSVAHVSASAQADL